VACRTFFQWCKKSAFVVVFNIETGKKVVVSGYSKLERTVKKKKKKE